MTTDPRIEAAARALYGDVNKPHAKDKGWDEVLPRWQESYRSNATAAVAAIDKAATITSKKQFNQLVPGTVVRTKEGDVHVFEHRGKYGVVNNAQYWSSPGWENPDHMHFEDLQGARVIHWGTE